MRLFGRKQSTTAPSRDTDPKEIKAKRTVDQHFEYGQALRETKNPGKKQAVSELQVAIAGESLAAMKILHDFNELRIKDFKQRAGSKYERHPFTAPTHPGYTNMAILLEKEKNYSEAIRISKRAKDQGWNGDWDKRIARCEAKLEKDK